PWSRSDSCSFIGPQTSSISLRETSPCLGRFRWSCSVLISSCLIVAKGSNGVASTQNTKRLFALRLNAPTNIEPLAGPDKATAPVCVLYRRDPLVYWLQLSNNIRTVRAKQGLGDALCGYFLGVGL